MMIFSAELEPIQWAVVPSSRITLSGVMPFFLHRLAYSLSVGGEIIL